MICIRFVVQTLLKKNDLQIKTVPKPHGLTIIIKEIFPNATMLHLIFIFADQFKLY